MRAAPLTPTASRSDSAIGGLAGVLVIAGAMAFAVWYLPVARELRNGWGGPPPALPTFPQIEQQFVFKDQTGRAVYLRELRKKPAVVGFFFTRCTQSCPQLMQAMKQLSEKLANQDVRIIALTVEGQHDTPEVLGEYAKKLGTGPNWLYLTANAQLVRQAAKFVFQVTVAEDAKLPIGQHITHSNRLFVLAPGGEVVYQGEVLTHADPNDPNSPFVIDEPALRQLKIAALDAVYPVLGPGDLPHVNFILNATAAVILLIGYAFVRAGYPRAHGATMVLAFLVSLVFLASYLFYHYLAGDKRFPGSGTIRDVYLGILISHVFLAIVTVPLALVALWLAARSRFTAHRRIARWTLPIWLYVSISGIAVYWLLYHYVP